MNVWRATDGARTLWGAEPSVVTIGNFDGVHRGHQHVIARAHDLAASLGRGAAAGEPLPVLAVTFDPHPTHVFAPDRAPVQLCSLRRRIELLKSVGAAEVFVLAFDQEMAAWPPEYFVQTVLVDELHAAGVAVGEDFGFGAKAAGDVDTLRSCGSRHGFTTVGLGLSGPGQPWSSTSVRALIAEGDVAGAAQILGRSHVVEGVVVEGDKRGREMGFPTANMPASTDLAVPADGVYAGRLACEGSAPLPAAISVGTNPTFDGVERRVESFVLDRDDLELYGVPVEVTFADRIRGQARFTGMDDLVVQMRADVEATRRVLSAHM